ncbi:nucleotidyltransferase domain-containing protein [Bacillaceae bacterium IKA-2]|nr:nucleotidyltransferase domain-containing protein [Bacillaceae bacterium IKA-2]
MGQQEFKKIEEFLISRLTPYCIYIFGSFAKGTSNKDSDIDIAYFSEIKVDNYERFMLAQELAVILNKNVDLIDLSQATTVFQTQIVSTGEVIYCSDDNRRMNFEMLTLKMYAKLNEERKEILKRIYESGDVYEV